MQECLINRLAGASLSLVKHCSVVQSIDEVYRVPRNYWRAQQDMPLKSRTQSESILKK